MDCTLWDSSWDQVVQESSYYMGQGWQCDFYFGYGHDIIEENALNEKLCVQVLRTLITKADSEIVELEEDLVILQNQLACADEEWSKICFSTLTEKIDCLVTSIQSLKNENVQDMHDFGDTLLMHRESADRVHEIVKALLGNYVQQKDEQPAKAIRQNSHSDVEKLVIDHSCKERNLRNSDSKISSEEAIERSSNPADPILDLHFKHEKECTDVAEKNKQEDIIIKDSSSYALDHATDNSSEKIESSKFDSKVIRKEGGQNNKSTTMGRSKISNLSLKSAGKGTKLPEAPGNAILRDSNSDASRHATGSKGKDKLSRTDLEVVMKKEVIEIYSTEKSIMVKSSLKPGVKGTNISEAIEPADAVLSSNSDASEAETEDSKPKLSGGLNAAQTDKMDSSNLSSKREEKIKRSPSRVKGRDYSGPNDTERTVEDPLSVPVCQIRDTTKPQPKTNRRPIPKQVQNAELAATGKLNSNLSLNPQRQRGKREPGFSSVEVHSDSSSITKSKGQLRFGMADDQISFTQSASMGTNKKAQSGLCYTEEKQGVTPDVSIEVPLSPYNRKRSSNLPDLDKTKKVRSLQISSAQLHTTDSTTGKDLGITGSSFPNDSDNSTVKGLPSPELPNPNVVGFKSLLLADLKAIAKQQNLKGYYKLRKAELANLLGLDKEVGGGGNEGKQELPLPLMIEGKPGNEK